MEAKEMQKNEITQKELRKLSSTKIKILKSLKERRKTLSEISRELNLSKSTVHAHLNDLCKEGFVKRVENGYKWVYYELTEKAELFLEKYVRNIAIIVSSSVVSLFASIYLLAKYFAMVEHKQKYVYKGVALGPDYGELVTLVLSLIFAFTGSVLILFYLKIRRCERVC